MTKNILRRLVLTTLCMASACRGAEKTTEGIAVITVEASDPTLAYAETELRHFLRTTTSLRIENAGIARRSDWTFQIETDPSLPESAFAIRSSTRNSGRGADVRLTGHDAACALHAVYTMLEHAGIAFDITGPILPVRLNLEKIKNLSVVVKPAVKRRGIRQHINFPMDISSYPLAEAREYVRNLARLRMNHIAFHSYAGQWLSYTKARETVLAGNFFYGQRHDIPDHPAVKSALRNRKTFCIPEIEPLYEQPAEKSRAAIQWLTAVIGQAKQAGMTVGFSIEAADEPLDDALSACRAALKTYPTIDSLDLMTRECGGYGGASLSADQVREKIAQLFGKEAAGDPDISTLVVGGLVQLPVELDDLARNIRVVEELRKGPDRLPQINIGIYATEAPTLRLCLALLRRFATAGTGFAFMPAHGGRAVVESVRKMELTAEDWRRTMLYGWIEFDGNLYLQQNSVEGTRRLLELAKTTIGEEQLAGLCFNHWRTAENRTAIRYAALACVEGAIQPEEFYRRYAGALKVGEPEKFVKGMGRLDDVDARGRDALFNIGFCFAGCWMGPPGMAWIRGWKRENVRGMRDAFTAVRRTLEECLKETQETGGREYLRFLSNRIECSEIHLDAIDRLLELTPLCNDRSPDKLDEAGRKKVMEQCRAADELAEKYMETHARMIVDRGCEGTLISYYATIPVFIDKVRTLFGKGRSESAPAPGDGPPPPATTK